MQLVPGVVTQVSPLQVTLDGASTTSTAYREADYSPVLNDRVAVLTPYRGNAVFVLGKEAT